MCVRTSLHHSRLRMADHTLSLITHADCPTAAQIIRNGLSQSALHIIAEHTTPRTAQPITSHSSLKRCALTARLNPIFDGRLRRRRRSKLSVRAKVKRFSLNSHPLFLQCIIEKNGQAVRSIVRRRFWCVCVGTLVNSPGYRTVYCGRQGK